jgi:hypothetical protein
MWQSGDLSENEQAFLVLVFAFLEVNQQPGTRQDDGSDYRGSNR